MKVVCIDNINNQLKLTIGKVYVTTDLQRGYYFIKSDIGHMILYPKNLFLTMNEYRNKKLEEIGI
jgi:hypothetical protein